MDAIPTYSIENDRNTESNTNKETKFRIQSFNNRNSYTLTKQYLDYENSINK